MHPLSELESAIERVQRALSTQQSCDLSSRQLRAFLMIAKASIEEDPLTTEDLRRYLNLSSQTAHNTVTYFVHHGFVKREVATFDGRAKHLHLTAAGKTIAMFLMGESDETVTTVCEEVRRYG